MIRDLFRRLSELLSSPVIDDKPNKGYRFRVWVPDGSGNYLYTDDEQTAELMKDGFYMREDGNVACITCGGNCGQCGNTGRLGNIGFSMQHLADNLTEHKKLRGTGVMMKS